MSAAHPPAGLLWLPYCACARTPVCLPSSWVAPRRGVTGVGVSSSSSPRALLLPSGTRTALSVRTGTRLRGPLGGGQGGPDQEPRLGPRVPLMSLCVLASGTPTGPFKWIKKARSLMHYRNIIVFLLLITFQVNYIATGFVLCDITAKSACGNHTPWVPPTAAPETPIASARGVLILVWRGPGSGKGRQCQGPHLPCRSRRFSPVRSGVALPCPDSPSWHCSGVFPCWDPRGSAPPPARKWLNTAPRMGGCAGDRAAAARGGLSREQRMLIPELRGRGPRAVVIVGTPSRRAACPVSQEQLGRACLPVCKAASGPSSPRATEMNILLHLSRDMNQNNSNIGFPRTLLCSCEGMRMQTHTH